MKDYKKVESCLKSFLKNNKRLSYSIALLITFLINGGFSYADEAAQVPLRTELKTRIEKEQKNISQMLEEAEDSMKDIELKIKKLTQRGEFWVKPLEKSSQLFFFANWGNYSKNKNKTESNFTGPEYSASSGANMDYGQFYNGKWYGEYGIVKNPLEFVDKIDFGANITPKTVEEKTIVEKTVTPKAITAPSVPEVKVTVDEIKPPTVSTPSIDDMEAPDEPNIQVTVPGSVPTLSAITVTPVAALNVNPTAPTVGEAPSITAPTVAAPATPAGFNSSVILTPAAPAAPAAPGISLFDPVRLSFNGTGFGQGSSPITSQGGLYLENYDTYNTTAPVYLTYTSNGRTMTGGEVQVTTGGGAGTSLSPGDSSSQGVYFISDAADHSVTINGDYHITRASDLGNGTLYFVSLNPYEVGRNKSTDGVYNFAGNLTLYGHNNPNSSNLLLGFEHQLLANDGSGSSHFANVENGKVTSILKNTGTITLQSGYNIVGIQIDTEYGSSSNGYFRKQPETRNEGKIIINSERSIGIDYGWYREAAPNTKLTLGNIEINGQNNYGLRMKSYADKSSGQVYYDKTNIDGSNGIIKVRGNKNIGVSIAQGQSTGDPIGRITALNIEVGGTNNIGFYRNLDSTAGINTNAMVLNSTTLGNTFTFDSSAIGSVLVRSDKNEVILERDFTGAKAISGIGEKNSLMQAGGTGIVTFATGKTATATAKEFYGMTAGNFDSNVANKTSGAKAVNKGTLEISGVGSIAMAADGDKGTSKNNTIENQGKIKFNGSKGTGIYNLGTFIQNTNGELEINGSENIGLYNTGTSTIEGKVKIEGTNGSIGIYSKGGVVEYTGATPLAISVDDSSSSDKKTLAVFASEGAQIKINNAQISVKDGAVGLIAAGKDASNNGSKIEAKNATIKYSGKGYAVYAEDSGKIDITNARLELGGKATGMELNLSGTPSVIATGATIHVKSDDVTVYNLSNVSTALNVSTLQNDLNSVSGVTSITADAGIDKYKLASLDGGAINIDTPISRTDAVGTAGYTFYRRFLAQRTKLNVTKDVTAVMNSTEAKDYNNQVVGLEMNSSKNATSVNETAINLVNSKIIADRTDSGAGAIGAFINYGLVNIDGTSKIEVEKEANVVNKQAVGVYAVNGSKVDNKGTIDVGGDQSVGILGMAYREDSSNNPIVNEFGGKAGEGTVNITNSKDIKMSGKDAIGIYAMNNKTGSTAADHVVTNEGTVEVGDSENKTAVGIYADKVTVKPEGGKIKIGKGAVGIYANESTVGEASKDLGTIDFNGKNGVGIYLKGNNSKLDGSKLTLTQSSSGNGKVGVLADRGIDTTVKTSIDMGTGANAVNDTTAYYTKSSKLTVEADLTLNKNSIGISGDNQDLVYGSGTDSYHMNLGEGSTGVFGTKKIDLKDDTHIDLNGKNSVGAYAKGATGKITSEGNINFQSENSIGLYGAEGAEVIDKTASMSFTGKNNIGVYLAGANWERDSVLAFNSDHSKGNIYLFAQGSHYGGTNHGSKVTLKNAFEVSPSGTATDTEKTIGMYLDTAVKDKAGEYADNTLDMSDNNAKVKVDKKGIGVYAKNSSNSNNNIIKFLKVESDGEGSVGLFTDGNTELDGTGNGGKIEAKNKGIGIYGKSGKIVNKGIHGVEITSGGTGAYLTNGSYLSGTFGGLQLKNLSSDSAAGVYYTKGNNTDEVTHSTKLTVVSGDNLVALYADDGIKLKNDSDIEILGGKNNVGAYAAKGSTFTNLKEILTKGNNIANGTVGIYAQDAEAINETSGKISITDKTANDLSIGMVASTTSGTGKVINKGTIEVTGDAIGMSVGDNAEGTNTGKITAEDEAGLKAIGAYVNGANAKFTNSGTISSQNIALALKDTTAGNVKNTGTLKLTKTGAVGVYANNSVIDFNITTDTTGVEKTVALYATGGTKIKSTITSAPGKTHIGAYLDGDAVFESGSKVIVNDGEGKNFGIGIYTKDGYNKLITTDIQLNGAKAIGLYLGTGGTGSKVEHEGTIDVGSGIGTYVPEKSKFTAKNTTFNVGANGTAVYLKGGDVDLGATGKATINFTGSGRAIFQEGGNITTGSGLKIIGSGSFLALKNANSTINSLVQVGKDGIGINGIYDKTGSNYALTLDSPNGKLLLDGDKATGIAAVAKSIVSPNKVDIVNKGTIETVSGSETTGIYGVGANIDNQGKISIGTKGVGIYTTNENGLENTTLNNAGEVNLTGDEATGIVAVKAKTNQDFIIGKIAGTKDKLVGVYFKDSVTSTTVKDFDISLKTNAKGLVFNGGQDFTVTSTSTNKVTIGDTTDKNSRGIGISALGVNGNVSKTDVVVGKDSLGLYVKDKKLTFDLSSGKLESSDVNKSSILAYADGIASEVALNGGGTLKVGANGIALGTKGGKITADIATTVEVDGVKGLGAYVENGGEVSHNFDIKVKSAEGVGMYAKGGAVNSVAKVSEIKGNKSIGYVFENITNAVNITNSVQLTDVNATEQVGVVAQGTGAGLTVAGISVVGSKNTGVYSSTGKTVTNNGTLNVGDSTGESSIGIYSKGGAVTSTGNAIIGKNSVGIYGKDTGAELAGDVTIDEKGIGLYVDNVDATKGDTKVTGNVTVGANGAIGIQVTNSKIELGGDLTVGDNDSKGIFSKDAGDITTNGDITVGKDSVGIYKQGTGEVKTAAGKTLTVAEKGYGIFSKGAKVTNNMNVTVGKDAIGVYVDGNDLTSTGAVTVGDKGVGLLVKGAGKTLTSTGNITVGSNNSVGLYAGDDANISQSGNITVADNNGIGVYSKGSGNVTTSGNITVGKDSIGVYKDGKGTMNIGIASQAMAIGDKGYGIYYKGNSVADSVINSNMNMTLGKEAVGIYGKNTKIDHTGDITVGETTIASNGFSSPTDNKNSIGIFGDNSNINFKGNMLVDKPLSAGIYAANGGSITVKSGSTITVKNGATGIMTGSKVETITLENGSILNVDGKVDTSVYTNASKNNVSFGIAAYSGAINNQGTINVTNGATGIYLAGTASLFNEGTINFDATSKAQDKPDTKASAELGGIKVTDKGVVTINGKVINGGTIRIKGDLNMQGIGLDISTGKTIIDAKSISGVAEVLPNFSKGNSEQKITVKDVFKTVPGGIGAFSGDVKSKSVSWIAKISKDPNDTTTTTKDITMVRIPYNSLISGERYKNLASGLEDIRSKIGVDSSSPIFKSLDNITSHGDFARAVANIRGDVYSNIQERMKTVESAFDKSYDELLSSYNKTKNVNKFSVIYTGGEHKDSTFGVSGYKHKTTGVLYVNDREAFTYGGKYGWSAGIVGSNFEFNGDTNKGSKERVVSGKLGLHYQSPLNKDDDNARLKWLTRAEFTVNNHRTKRYSQVGADTYQNKASFYSTELSWKNTISYDYDINTNWTVKPYTGIDMSYGHIFNAKEKNEGLPLEVKGKDYFVITPNVGVETKYVLPLGATHQLFSKLDTEFSYDVTKLYHGVNQAKMKNASSGYYDLSKPERRRARVAVGAELGLEKENTYGVTFRAEYQGYKKSQLNYGVRLNYKF